MGAKYLDIQAFYGIGWRKFLRKLHVIKRMSSYEIAEKLWNDMGIVYTYKAVQLWLKKFGFLRSHEKALRNSVLTGRKDYSLRNFDYEGRFIDYEARSRRKGYLWAVGLRRLLRNKGDAIRLAKAINSDGIYRWKNLRNRVPEEPQERICAYFGLDKSQIFSRNKTFDVPKLINSYKVRKEMKSVLIKKGYLYATNLKKILYEKNISIQDLADKIGKSHASVSRFLSGRQLVSPLDQERIENTLCIYYKDIFSVKP